MTKRAGHKMGAIATRKTTGIVFRKEMLDGIRDWRSLGFALIYPFFGPLMILAVFYFTTNGDEWNQYFEFL